MIEVPAGTVVVFADLLCPFAHVAVHRLWTTRSRLGLDDAVVFEMRAFPLELFNGPGTRIGSDSEVPVLGRLEPGAGWQLWNSPDWHYPNTVLLAFEAVHAAREQGRHAGETLDRALRRAFWADSRSIGHHSVILDVARAAGLDDMRLAAALADGRARSAVFDDYAVAGSDLVSTSPHVFLPDGTSYVNPGVEVRWQGEWARGFPVIEGDDPGVYEHILKTAAQPVRAGT
jgi:predicted DsbA family dithiol-disulfide isomerase